MGVDYVVWLIPKDRTFRPRADQIAGLANALREDRWVPTPDSGGHRSCVLELLPGEGSAGIKPVRSQLFPATPIEPGWIEFHSQEDLILEWWVNDAKLAGVQFPFNFVPYPESPQTYFGIRIILGHEYFYGTGETVMEFEDSDTRCRCGEQLAYWTGWASGAPSQRIRAKCPKCGAEFDPSGVPGDILDGWRGERRVLSGGLTFRFALQVDCHKNFPHEPEQAQGFRLQDTFLALWSNHINVPYELIETWD